MRSRKRHIRGAASGWRTLWKGLLLSANLILLSISSIPGGTDALQSAIGTPPKSVYVNLPFCRRRCFYCDFPIEVVGDRPGAADAAAKPYVEKLLREIRTTAAELDRGGLLVSPGPGDGRRPGVSTLYFGGGTPSLCPPELVGQVIDSVRACYGIAPGAEITMEMDPGTFDEERLLEYLSLGVSRVSMGVQSFDAELLASCGRAHSLEDVHEALEATRKAGVENFSIDLISGLPNQTVDQWHHTLREAVSTGASHISIYDLQVEAGTAFGRWYVPGQEPLPEDDVCAEMYRAASRVLGGAGYEHYEVSNYARPGFQSRHNRAYWENVPFLAFGNGAASYVAGERFARPRGLPDYYRWVEALEREGWARATASSGAGVGEAGDGPAGPPDDEDGLLDAVMLGFRLKEGLDLDAVAAAHGATALRGVEAGVAEGLRRGWVVRDEHRDVGGGGSAGGRGRLRLSDPEGYLFSNSVISSVFCEVQRVKTLRRE